MKNKYDFTDFYIDNTSGQDTIHVIEFLALVFFGLFMVLIKANVLKPEHIDDIIDSVTDQMK
jgi:hypothetical protein